MTKNLYLELKSKRTYILHLYKKILNIQENKQYNFKICKRFAHTFQQGQCIGAPYMPGKILTIISLSAT